MANQSSLVLNNAVGTAMTFAPRGAKKQPDGKDVALWRDQSVAGSIPLSWPSITETHIPPNSNGMEKFRFVVDIPTLEVTGTTAVNDQGYRSVPQKAFSTVGVIEVWVSTRASSLEIGNTVAFLGQLANSAYFVAAVNNRDPAY